MGTSLLMWVPIRPTQTPSTAPNTIPSTQRHTQHHTHPPARAPTQLTRVRSCEYPSSQRTKYQPHPAAHPGAYPTNQGTQHYPNQPARTTQPASARPLIIYIKVSADYRVLGGKQCRERWHQHLNPEIFQTTKKLGIKMGLISRLVIFKQLI